MWGLVHQAPTANKRPVLPSSKREAHLHRCYPRRRKMVSRTALGPQRDATENARIAATLLLSHLPLLLHSLPMTTMILHMNTYKERPQSF